MASSKTAAKKTAPKKTATSKKTAAKPNPKKPPAPKELSAEEKAEFRTRMQTAVSGPPPDMAQAERDLAVLQAVEKGRSSPTAPPPSLPLKEELQKEEEALESALSRLPEPPKNPAPKIPAQLPDPPAPPPKASAKTAAAPAMLFGPDGRPLNPTAAMVPAKPTAPKATRLLVAESLSLPAEFEKAGIARTVNKYLGKTQDPGVKFWLPSGITLLDLAINYGGYPGGKVTEFHGMPGGGKTLHAMLAVASAQGLGGIGVWLDPEAGFSVSLATKIAKMDITRNFIYRRPKSMEIALDFLVEVIPQLGKAGRPAVVVVDSMQGLCPAKMTEDDFKFSKDPEIAKNARLTSRWFCRSIRDIADASNVVVILINQERSNVNTDRYQKGPKAPSQVTPGGKAAEYYASVRIEVNRFTMDQPDAERKAGRPPAGVILQSWISKNRVGPPFRTATYPNYFREDSPALGIDDGLSCLSYLIAKKEIVLVKKDDGSNSNQYAFGPYRGTKRALQKMALTDPGFRADLINAARDAYLEHVGRASDVPDVDDEDDDDLDV